MLYAGLVWLNMDEKDFWKLTPRKLYLLLDVHRQVRDQENGGTSKSKKKGKIPTAYIDQIGGW